MISHESNVDPPSRSDIWFTLSFKNDPRILAHASALHDQLVADLIAFIPEQDFVTQCLFQPLPALLGQRSVAAGGNVMGVDQQPHNGVLFLATAMVRTPEQEAFAYPKVKACVDSVSEFARGIEGGLLPWRYLNYADKRAAFAGLMLVPKPSVFLRMWRVYCRESALRVRDLWRCWAEELLALGGASLAEGAPGY